MTIKIRISSMLTTLLVLLSAHSIYAQSTTSHSDAFRTISYQGFITDSDGSLPLDGIYSITVSLFADPSGTVRLWHDTYSVAVIGGIFCLNLGSGDHRLPDPATMNSALWVGMQIGDSPEMHPLSLLTASPYALNVPDKVITADKLADESVTAEKVAMPYLSAVEVNGVKVAGSGTVLNLKSGSDIHLDYNRVTNSLTVSSNGIHDGNESDSEKGSVTLNGFIPVGNWIGRTTVSDALIIQTPSEYNTLGGGFSNIIGQNSSNSTIVGGKLNEIGEDVHGTFIGGGETNKVFSNLEPPEAIQYSTIVGGHDSRVHRSYGTIGGGHENKVFAEFGSIAGGWINELTGEKGFVGGGQLNDSDGPYSAASGGRGNWAYGDNSFVGGGEANSVYLSHSSIVGGLGNSIDAAYSVIVGGEGNYISEPNSFSGSGDENNVGGTHSVIGGGTHNDAVGDYSSIGGGSYNVASGPMSTIIGGERLATSSYGQAAVGLYNMPRGNWTNSFYFGPNNDPLFMVGNGHAGGHPSFPDPLYRNAFEVSYNGHSVVYDVNGTSSSAVPLSRIPYRGGTYVDNIIYAWGDITDSGTVVSDFGVRRANRIGAGIYDIEIDVRDPQSGAQVVLNSASITVTLTDSHEPPLCAFINASRIGTGGPNHFRVRVRDANCNHVDGSFKFKVTGRP